MKKITVFILFVSSYIDSVLAQPDLYQWDYRYGGSGDDWLYEFKPTSDGGYILGGFTYSGISGDKGQSSWGDRDYWIVKTNELGILEWERRYGGSSSDILHCMHPTADGGFITGGMCNSPVSGDKTEPIRGSFDYWIVKTDALGNIEWEKRYGGPSSDDLRSIYQTSDGGYILGGRSLSGTGGDKTGASWGSGDWWVVKIDATGNLIWEKTYGGAGDEYFTTILQTPDGGYLLSGNSSSGISGDKTEPSKGSSDFWIIKTDVSGNILWDKSYGGSSTESLYSLIATTDAGFMLAGISWSPVSGDKSQPCWGWNDYWLVKIDALGNPVWERDFGGTDLEENMGNVIQTLDGGYLVSGVSYSTISGNKTEANLGYRQQWAIKTDGLGNVLWDKTIFTNDQDVNGFVAESDSGCYTFASFTPAGIGGDKTQTSWGSSDYWFIKLCSEVVVLPIQLLSFSGTNVEGKNLLNWSTASEINSYSFEIQKSSDSKQFSNIGQINAAGHSITPLSYNFVDYHPFTGINYYRLKQTDFNGAFDYSQTIAITSPATDYPCIILYPNPAQDYFSIQLPPLNSFDLNITDVSGKIIYQEKNAAGEIKIDCGVFPKGVYFITAQNYFSAFTGKIIVQ